MVVNMIDKRVIFCSLYKEFIEMKIKIFKYLNRKIGKNMNR